MLERSGISTLLISLVVLLTGCMTWKRSPVPVTQLLSHRGEEAIRVRLRDSTTVTVQNPRIENEFLVGTQGARVPIDQVVYTEVYRVNAAYTALTVVFAVGLGISAAYVFQANKNKPLPRPDTAVISCPLVYSWTGEGWRLDSGTFGGAITRGLARTDIDNLEHLKVVDGQVRLRVTNELDETDHLDELRILLVEHPRGTSVAPGAGGEIEVLGPLTSPFRATDLEGRDVLDRVMAADGWSWESDPTIHPAEAAPPRDGIELDFLRPRGTRSARLVVDANNTPWSAFLMSQFIEAHGRETNAWYAALDNHPAMARAFGERVARESFLRASVQTAAGWKSQGVLWEAGPEIVKRQVLNLDLRDVGSDTVRVRLDAPRAFWLIDRVQMEFAGPGPRPKPLAVTELSPVRATTSRGRNVLDVLSRADGRELTLETGDRADLVFGVPDSPRDHERTILLETHGWYHIHTSDRGEPDRALLWRIETEPGGIAAAAAERLNRVLVQLNSAGQ